MSEDEVGYRKPPKGSRFQKGVSGNPKGRPKRKPLAPSDIVEKVRNAPVEYREGGRKRTAPRHELTVMTYVRRALRGDVRSAEALLELREHAQRVGGAGARVIEIDDWLPDYLGQTGEQKTRESAMQNEANASQEWESPAADPGDDVP